MRITTSKIVLFASALFFTSSVALAWGPATHAYISEQLNNKGLLLKLNQRYGAMAPDLFYFSTLPPNLQDALSLATHCDDGGFMRVWTAAQGTTATKKALAYGFATHNNAWGDDFYAHEPVCSGGTPTDGYVVLQAYDLTSKGSVLTNRQDVQDLVAALSNAGKLELGTEMAQDVIEAAVDILLKNEDAHIGDKVVASATLRSPEFLPLLIKAYATYFYSQGYFTSDAAAAQAIISAEFAFRAAMTLYGCALMQDQATAKQLISDALVIRFASLLQAYGISFPLNELASLTKAALDLAVTQCAAAPPDFVTIINGVKMGLSTNEISY